MNRHLVCKNLVKAFGGFRFKFDSLDLPGKTEYLLRMFDLARHGDQLAGSLSHGD